MLLCQADFVPVGQKFCSHIFNIELTWNQYTSGLSVILVTADIVLQVLELLQFVRRIRSFPDFALSSSGIYSDLKFIMNKAHVLPMVRGRLLLI